MLVNRPGDRRGLERRVVVAVTSRGGLARRVGDQGCAGESDPELRRPSRLHLIRPRRLAAPIVLDQLKPIISQRKKTDVRPELSNPLCVQPDRFL